MKLRVASHFPGRLRVRAAAFEDAAFGKDVATQLAAEPGVSSATPTPFTGSLLVLYDARTLQLPWLIQLISKIAQLDGIEADHTGELIPGGPAIRTALDRWNGAVFGASRGTIDARTAVPGALATLGTLSLLFGRRGLPQWYDLLFWSFVTFVNLNPPAVNGESS